VGKLTLTMLVTVALTLPAAAWAQKPSAYPTKGQTATQQSTDDGQCLAWAKQSTGIDPAVAAAPPPPGGPQGERLRGAARGAAAGAVVGEIVDGDSSKGAGVGATAGVVAGGARARRNKAAQAQQAQATQAQTLGTYYSAYGACMEGRGYIVK
jgi:OmpA family protein